MECMASHEHQNITFSLNIVFIYAYKNTKIQILHQKSFRTKQTYHDEATSFVGTRTERLIGKGYE